MTCSGLVTDANCSFSCNVGYDLVGSHSRTCLPSSRWSGNLTFCKGNYNPSFRQEHIEPRIVRFVWGFESVRFEGEGISVKKPDLYVHKWFIFFYFSTNRIYRVILLSIFCYLYNVRTVSSALLKTGSLDNAVKTPLGVVPLRFRCDGCLKNHHRLV